MYSAEYGSLLWCSTVGRLS